MNKREKWETGMHPISNPLCHTPCFHSCPGPHLAPALPSDHGWPTSSTSLAQSPLPISFFFHFSIFLTEDSFFRNKLNAWASQMLQLHFVLRKVGKNNSGSDFCTALIQPDVLARSVPTARSLGLLRLFARW